MSDPSLLIDAVGVLVVNGPPDDEGDLEDVVAVVVAHEALDAHDEAEPDRVGRDKRVEPELGADDVLAFVAQRADVVRGVRVAGVLTRAGEGGSPCCRPALQELADGVEERRGGEDRLVDAEDLDEVLALDAVEDVVVSKRAVGACDDEVASRVERAVTLDHGAVGPRDLNGDVARRGIPAPGHEHRLAWVVVGAVREDDLVARLHARRARRGLGRRRLRGSGVGRGGFGRIGSRRARRLARGLRLFGARKHRERACARNDSRGHQTSGEASRQNAQNLQQPRTVAAPQR